MNRKGRFVADVVEIVISKIQVCRQDCLSELSVRYSIIGPVFSAVTLVALSEYELLTSFLQMVDMLNQMLPINLNPAHFVGSSFFFPFGTAKACKRKLEERLALDKK